MEIQQLRHLIAAIENRNLLKAADKAYISQSGLSRSLKSLEHRLGVPLLIRGPKGVEPTIYGLTVIRRAKVILNEVARSIEEVRAIEMAISASNRATAGNSVTRAILSYVGRPLRLWRGRRWATGYGWQNLGRERFEIRGMPPLGARLVALSDVPDLALLPGRVAGTPAVTFRAGTEFAVHNLALWAASWLVRRGWIARLDSYATAILSVQGLTRSFGSDRSGMIVRLFGISARRRLERRWTLIAGNGTGPEIPTLAIPLLVARISRGEIGPGACDAGPLLDLEDFAPGFEALGIRHETVDIEQPPPLYRQVMGPDFDRLPPRVRAMHDVLRDGGACGRATVARGSHPLARLAAALFSFPPAGEHELHVGFRLRNCTETWTRDFSGSRFTSRLSRRGSRLVEHFGPLHFGFRLEGDGSGLTMHISRWWLGPVPMPLALAPRSLAREWEEDGRFQFDVPIALPLIGQLVHYRGWLIPVPDEPSTDAPEGLPR